MSGNEKLEVFFDEMSAVIGHDVRSDFTSKELKVLEKHFSEL